MILPPGSIGALRALLVGPGFSRLPECGLLGAVEVWTSIPSQRKFIICMKASGAPLADGGKSKSYDELNVVLMSLKACPVCYAS